MSNTLPERLRQAAQSVWQNDLYDVLTDAADALESAEPFAWVVRNGVVCHEIFRSQIDAEVEANTQQRRHDLSGSLAAFNVQPLYTVPQPQERKPMTDDKAVQGFCNIPHPMHYLQAFIAGVRFAEREHGIKEKP